MSPTERVINDLNVVKITLCNLQMPLTPEMRIKIGQVITSAIDLLKDQSDWIPVKEKPPEKPGHYLTASDAPAGFPKLIRILMFVKDLHETDPCNFRGKHRPGWVDWDDEYGYYEYDAVTHWMPLPEPPEENEHVRI